MGRMSKAGLKVQKELQTILAKETLTHEGRRKCPSMITDLIPMDFGTVLLSISSLILLYDLVWNGAKIPSTKRGRIGILVYAAGVLLHMTLGG